MLPTILEKPSEPIAGKTYIHDQIMDWMLNKKTLNPADMTNIALPLRGALERQYSFNTLHASGIQKDSDGACKILFRMDGREPAAYVESVFIPSRTHSTACLSTQAGCAVGCLFCATGKTGPGRNLDFSEIVLQHLNLERELRQRISHIVLMGMGEPLLNYEQTIKAIAFFEESKLHISARHITLSTVGIPDCIRRMLRDRVRVELALSLHSAIEEKRRRLIPWSGLSPIDETIAACDEYFAAGKRLPTIEYVLVAGVNDQKEDSAALARLLSRRRWKVNLIAMNGEVAGCLGSSLSAVKRFKADLEARGLRVTIRRSVGKNIRAACGQLSGGANVHGTLKLETGN